MTSSDIPDMLLIVISLALLSAGMAWALWGLTHGRCYHHHRRQVRFDSRQDGRDVARVLGAGRVRNAKAGLAQGLMRRGVLRRYGAETVGRR